MTTPIPQAPPPPFVPLVSLHAAARSAQSRGENVQERDILADASMYRRSRHHVLRLFFASSPVELVDPRSGIFVNATRTRVLVVIEGVVVTVIRAPSSDGLNDKRLRRMCDRLRDKRERGLPRGRPWWQEAEELEASQAA